MAILTVGGLFFEPLIGILTKLSGLDVPDAGSLSVLIWAPGIALFSWSHYFWAVAKNRHPTGKQR